MNGISKDATINDTSAHIQILKYNKQMEGVTIGLILSFLRTTNTFVILCIAFNAVKTRTGQNTPTKHSI